MNFDARMQPTMQQIEAKITDIVQVAKQRIKM